MDLRKILSYKDIKMGYSVDDRKEFKIIRNYIVNNRYSPDLFDKNLKSLILEENMGKSQLSEICAYDPVMNKINGKMAGVNFIHELFHMSSNNEETQNIGIMTKDGFAESLNEGITDYFTQVICPNYIPYYHFEVLLLESINYLYGFNIGSKFKYYFLGDSEGFFNSFKEDKELIKSAVRELDAYTKLDYKNYNILMNDLKEERVPAKEIFDHLVNAFIIIIKMGNKKGIGEDIFEDFEYSVREHIHKNYTEDIISRVGSVVEGKRKL